MSDVRKETACQLAALNQLGVAIDASDAKIKAAARARLEAVRAEIESLRPKVLLDSTAGDRYQALLVERGWLRRLSV